MIRLTKLNGEPIIINADLIEFIETTPDTLITLTTGKKIIVKEKEEEVIEKIIKYKAQILKEKDKEENWT